MASLLNSQKEKLVAILSKLSPSSQEDELTSYIMEECQRDYSCKMDPLGNVLVSLRGKFSRPIILTSHCDEIGLQVTYITEDGYIRFRAVGGVDVKSLPGRFVQILNIQKKVTGVICKAPIHVEDKRTKETPTELADLWIDIGCSSLEEVEKKVQVGDMIGFVPNIAYLGDKRMSCKALDNKLGVFVVLTALSRLKEEELNNSVTAVFSVQEEVGSKGISAAGEAILPAWGICVDVGIATDCPNISKEKYGSLNLGAGPGLVYCSDTNRQLTDKVAALLTQKRIPYQRSVGLGISGGTDTKQLQVVANGVPCVLLSIPLRSMHTPSEVCDLDDVAYTIDAIVEIIKNVEYGN